MVTDIQAFRRGLLDSPRSEALARRPAAARKGHRRSHPPAVSYNETTTAISQSFVGTRAAAPRANHSPEGEKMKNPLDSLWGTVISGVILTAVLYVIVRSILV
jgi:hypothetical protein